MQADPKLLEMEQKLIRFISNTEGLKEQLQASIEGSTRFNINLDLLRTFDKELCDYFISHPSKALGLFEKKLNEMKGELEDKLSRKEAVRAGVGGFPTKTITQKVSIDGNLGKNFVTPRGLKNSLINQLVKVQGIVTRMSIAKTKL